MDIETLFREGEQEYKNKNFELATLKYSKILAVQPKHLGALEQRSMCYFHLEKLEESLKDMNRLRELEPNNPYRYSSRAYLKGKMKDLDGAIEDYRRAVHLDPKDAIAYNNLGLLLEQKGYQDQATESWKKADELAQMNEGFITASVNEKSNSKQDDISEEVAPSSVQREIKSVFTSRKGFAEFARFIFNGFRLNK
jgi:tetratricopeptide (TPR) repeat protein